MTNWQMFALASPVIVVLVMWLQGLAEGYFDRAPSSDRHPIGGGSGFLLARGAGATDNFGRTGTERQRSTFGGRPASGGRH